MPVGELGGHELRERLPQELAGGAAEQPLRRGVERSDASVDVERDDRVGRGAHQNGRERVVGERALFDRLNPGGE